MYIYIENIKNKAKSIKIIIKIILIYYIGYQNSAYKILFSNYLSIICTRKFFFKEAYFMPKLSL